MCYEVFNRSAADSHLRAVRRERLAMEQERGAPDLPDLPTESLRQSVDRLKESLPPVDWKEVRRQASDGIQRYRRPILIVLALWGMLMAWMLLRSPFLWINTLGARLTYGFNDKTPVQYLSTLTSEFRSWSERHSRMDTPLENFRLDELGNVTLRRKSGASKKEWRLNPEVNEWIVIRRDADRPAARSVKLPSGHLSLKGGPIVLDKTGRVQRRDYPPNARVGRSLNFIMPALPDKRLRQGDSWTQTVSWVEQIGVWKIFWSGKIVWKAQEASANDARSVTLNGRASVRPQIWESPSWASGAIKQSRFQSDSNTSEMVFDRTHGRLMSSSLSYAGTIDFPIDDLGRIPMELRVGRRVRGPGRVFLQLKNRIDIRKN